MMSKPMMSLKQFMLRAEILKLYRGFLRLGKFLNEPPPPEAVGQKSITNEGTNSNSDSSTLGGPTKANNPMRTEWNNWVRTEFRLRQASTTDEEMARALLGYGKRQLQEMERSIMLATNLNKPETEEVPTDNNNKMKSIKSSPCKQSNKEFNTG